jgi:hypothetical protein
MSTEAQRVGNNQVIRCVLCACLVFFVFHNFCNGRMSFNN